MHTNLSRPSEPLVKPSTSPVGVNGGATPRAEDLSFRELPLLYPCPQQPSCLSWVSSLLGD